MSAAEIVNKVPALPTGRWNYAHVLRDDGINYSEYVTLSILLLGFIQIIPLIGGLLLFALLLLGLGAGILQLQASG